MRCRRLLVPILGSQQGSGFSITSFPKHVHFRMDGSAAASSACPFVLVFRRPFLSSDRHNGRWPLNFFPRNVRRFDRGGGRLTRRKEIVCADHRIQSGVIGHVRNRTPLRNDEYHSLMKIFALSSPALPFCLFIEE